MALTPMMQQYLLMKEEYKDCLLLYRLGDFYELFFEDAILVSRELGLTLTGRDCGLEERAPMCGVPYHAVEGYIAKLIAKGYQVAICEQTSDPALSKGLVTREVIRVITPGTVIESSMLDEKRDNYILCLYLSDEKIGLAYCDVSTGSFHTGEIQAENGVLLEELARIQPAEVVTDESFFLAADKFPALFQAKELMVHPLSGDAFLANAARKRVLRQFGADSISALGLSNQPYAACSAGALLAYLEQTQKVALNHINTLNIFGRSSYMILDAVSRRNLELTQPLRSEGKKGTLLYVLDKTMTSMGSRMLRGFIEQPLQDADEINRRLTSVEELTQSALLTDNIRDILNETYDISRLCSKVSYGTLNARDCIALKNTLANLPRLKETLRGVKAELLCEICGIDPMQELHELLDQAIAPSPPTGVNEGNIIRDGYDKTVDDLRHISGSGRQLLTEMEAAEREATGIKNLKIGYNKVFGYYIEITKSNLAQVPYRYTRKQTLVNAERFITPELKELEERVLGAHDKCIQREYELFCAIRARLSSQIPRMQKAARLLALLDVLQSFAFVAAQQNYVRPTLNGKGYIEIKDGRHPVVEKNQPLFVANDTHLDKGQNRLLIITGPNMAGKSTYMRQVALITLMAHIGCFVPAKSADISLTDRIFTRVGASDDLSSGQSTFMVEMSEMAFILRSATADSLLLIDEIGRGTSTFDGLSIAWAVVEHIADREKIGAKTLFATHYHELSELEGQLEGVKNYRISVKEAGDNIVFLRKIVRGSADKSFGIQVAALAGIPQAVVGRAKEILAQIEEADINQSAALGIAQRNIEAGFQMNLFGEGEAIIDELKKLDVDSMAPKDALFYLYDLKNRVKGEV